MHAFLCWDFLTKHYNISIATCHLILLNPDEDKEESSTFPEGTKEFNVTEQIINHNSAAIQREFHLHSNYYKSGFRSSALRKNPFVPPSSTFQNP